MVLYIVRRILSLIPVFLGITIISFSVIHLAPGRPTTVMMDLNPKASLEVQARLEKLFGLDRPLHIQYIDWLRSVLTMDFGKSFIDGRPVIEKILERLPVTILINLLAVIIILTIAVPIGIKSAVQSGSLFDKMVTVIVFIGFAIPSFWLALVFMSLFGVRLGWFPVSGLASLDFENFSLVKKVLDIAWHLVLPVSVASIGGLAGFSRYMRQSMLEVLSHDYIRTARAKGLPERIVIYKHALRNALLPVVTILGLSVPGLISGSVIFESVFNIPGMGRLMVESVFMRDYNTIMAGLVISTILTLFGNLIADIAYFCIDPRIRVGQE